MSGKSQRVIGALRKAMGNRGAQRAERAFDEVPNLDRKFTEDALTKALSQPDTVLTPLAPSDFGKLALPFAKNYPNTKTFAKKTDKLSQLKQDPSFGGWTEVPKLDIALHPDSPVAQVVSHDGRHRSFIDSLDQDALTLTRLPLHLTKKAEELAFPDPPQDADERADILLQQLLLRDLLRPEASAHQGFERHAKEFKRLYPNGIDPVTGKTVSEMLHDLGYNRRGHYEPNTADAPGRERMRLLDILKPFRRGGLAQMRNC